jgi:hypothetical protein
LDLLGDEADEPVGGFVCPGCGWRTDTNPYADANTYTNSDSNPNSNPDSYPNPDSNADTHADAESDTHTDSVVTDCSGFGQSYGEHGRGQHYDLATRAG